MAKPKRKILIVEDVEVNRALLQEILAGEDYELLLANNGMEGLRILDTLGAEISLVLLDIVMPIMDGFGFLEEKAKRLVVKACPVIVVTSLGDQEVEERALKLGAVDFVTKPYNPVVIRQRVANIIALRESTALRNTLERDALTGLYNRDAFVHWSKLFLDRNIEDKSCQIISFDLDKFKVVNELYGHAKGDELIKYTALTLAQSFEKYNLECVIGRLQCDKFVVCVASSMRSRIAMAIDQVRRQIGEFDLPMAQCIRAGIFVAYTRELSVNSMCDRAQLALNAIKGRYNEYVKVYDDQMRQNMLAEQTLVSEMQQALNRGEFKVYYQGKYDLRTGKIIGAEALVRWQHPHWGLLNPDDFVPVFERNGFISTMDYYVAERVCSNLHDWIAAGNTPLPVSINISRVDVYDPNLCAILIGLVKKYDLDPRLLEIEITETAYTQNPKQLLRVVENLKRANFIIEMDDFGSGYSSLNMLGEVPFDVVKLDLRFLKNRREGKNVNIINFIISLLKWLGIRLLAEGIETKEEVVFLRSMGCFYGQGFYFTKALGREDFERLLQGTQTMDIGSVDTAGFSNMNLEDVWNPSSGFNTLFNAYVGALGVFELSGDEFLTLIRANDTYLKFFKGAEEEMCLYFKDFFELVYAEDKHDFYTSIVGIDAAQSEVTVDCRIVDPISLGVRWMHIKAKLLYMDKGKRILLVSFEDITGRKKKEEELRLSEEQFLIAVSKANNIIMRYYPATKELEIYGSGMNNRFKKSTAGDVMRHLCRAKCWKQESLSQWKDFFELVDTGVANGHRELCIEGENLHKTYYEGSFQNQFDAQGNPIQAICIFKDITESKQKELLLTDTARRDSLTGLLNRKVFGEEVQYRLVGQDNKSFIYGFGMVDLDNFKQINDKYGHLYGDKVLMLVADRLKGCFRANDLVARMGGDEFAFFFVTSKAKQGAVDIVVDRVIHSLSNLSREEEAHKITCSIGIAISKNANETFEGLYKKADKALYDVKKNGKGGFGYY